MVNNFGGSLTQRNMDIAKKTNT